MTFNRLILAATACMLLTGLTVYALTGPSAGQPAPSAQPPSATPANTPSTELPVPARGPARPSADPPKLDVWRAAPLVEIEGAAALGCTARTAQGWIRINCEDPKATGHSPKNLIVYNGTVLEDRAGGTGFTHKAWRTTRGDNVYTAVSPSVMNMVCPFVEGTLVEARFEWTDLRADLSIRWDDPTEPAVKGTFRRLP